MALSRYEEAFDRFDLVVERSGGMPDTLVANLVAASLLDEGLTFRALGSSRVVDCVMALDEIVTRCGNSADPATVGRVKRAEAQARVGG